MSLFKKISACAVACIAVSDVALADPERPTNLRVGGRIEQRLEAGVRPARLPMIEERLDADGRRDFVARTFQEGEEAAQDLENSASRFLPFTEGDFERRIEGADEVAEAVDSLLGRGEARPANDFDASVDLPRPEDFNLRRPFPNAGDIDLVAELQRPDFERAATELSERLDRRGRALQAADAAAQVESDFAATLVEADYDAVLAEGGAAGAAERRMLISPFKKVKWGAKRMVRKGIKKPMKKALRKAKWGMF